MAGYYYLLDGQYAMSDDNNHYRYSAYEYNETSRTTYGAGKISTELTLSLDVISGSTIYVSVENDVNAEHFRFTKGVSATKYENRIICTYNGDKTIKAIWESDYSDGYVYFIVSYFTPESYIVVKAKDLEPGESYGSIPSSVAWETSYFNNSFPTGTLPVKSLEGCFSGKEKITAAPSIPSSVINMKQCFSGCMSLETAPSIPTGVVNMDGCFKDCTSMHGALIVNNVPTSYSDAFLNVDDLFIINNAGTSAVETAWKMVAGLYSGVHFEADDHPVPQVSNMSVQRVASSGSTVYSETGLYAYIKATLNVSDKLIPDGWTNELKARTLTNDGSTVSPTWSPASISSYPADVECWVSIGNTSSHVFTLKISDSVKSGNTEKNSKESAVLTVTLPKAYALVDYYHDSTSDTEGMAIGKYAEYADLLDIEMDTRIKGKLTVDSSHVAITDGADIKMATVPYGTSPTAARTTTKVVTTSKGTFKLENGQIVVVKFDNATSTNTSLNVNTTGSKQAYYNGSRISSSNGAWAAGEVVRFKYDGTYYQRLDDGTDVDADLVKAIADLGWESDVLS